MTVSDLPALNACLNAACFCLLTAGFLMIKTKRRKAHAAFMIAAFVVSVAFLVSYVTHKVLVKGVHTPFHGEGLIRPAYYLMLFSHILLAMVNLPLVILTVRAAIRGNIAGHRKLARITFPIWMYVSVTGVLVYFMLYRWYPPIG